MGVRESVASEHPTRTRLRIVYIVTAIESAATLLRGQLAILLKSSFDVELICDSVGDGTELVWDRIVAFYTTLFSATPSRAHGGAT